MKIYTKTGDTYSSSVITKRKYKDDLVFDCLGTIDELQSALMLAVNQITDASVDEEVIIKTVKQVIMDLFDLGRDLLHYQEKALIHERKVFDFEDLIDRFDASLPELTDFIYPGASVKASQMHLARSISRRLERRIVEYGRKSKKINQIIFRYLNRLSDLLYVFARVLDKEEESNV